jgi:hypothetical protein
VFSEGAIIDRTSNTCFEQRIVINMDSAITALHTQRAHSDSGLHPYAEVSYPVIRDSLSVSSNPWVGASSTGIYMLFITLGTAYDMTCI